MKRRFAFLMFVLVLASLGLFLFRRDQGGVPFDDEAKTSATPSLGDTDTARESAAHPDMEKAKARPGDSGRLQSPMTTAMTVKVQTQSGENVEGAEVVERMGELKTLRGNTDASGEIVLYIAHAAGLALSARTPTSQSDEFILAEEIPRSITLVLRPSTNLTGNVLRADNTPAAGARVVAWAYNETAPTVEEIIGLAPMRTRSVVTDDQGAFVFDRALEGRYRLLAGGDGQCTITVVPAQAGTPVTLVMSRIYGAMVHAVGHTLPNRSNPCAISGIRTPTVRLPDPQVRRLVGIETSIALSGLDTGVFVLDQNWIPVFFTSVKDVPSIAGILYRLEAPGFHAADLVVEARPVLRGLWTEDVRMSPSCQGFGGVTLHVTPDLLGSTKGTGPNRHSGVAYFSPTQGDQLQCGIHQQFAGEALLGDIPFGSYAFRFGGSPPDWTFPSTQSPPLTVDVGPTQTSVEIDASGTGALVFEVSREDGQPYSGRVQMTLQRMKSPEWPTGATYPVTWDSAPYDIAWISPGQFEFTLDVPASGAAVGIERGSVTVVAGQVARARLSVARSR